jgi:hypothetical protein
MITKNKTRNLKGVKIDSESLNLTQSFSECTVYSTELHPLKNVCAHAKIYTSLSSLQTTIFHI